MLKWSVFKKGIEYIVDTQLMSKLNPPLVLDKLRDKLLHLAGIISIFAWCIFFIVKGVKTIW